MRVRVGPTLTVTLPLQVHMHMCMHMHMHVLCTGAVCRVRWLCCAAHTVARFLKVPSGGPPVPAWLGLGRG